MRGVAGNFVKLLTRQNAHRNADLAALVNTRLKRISFRSLATPTHSKLRPRALRASVTVLIP
jgi:hypothetical protein